MVFIAFVVSLILTLVFQFRKRQLGARSNSFWFHFFDKSLEFLWPFTIIAGIFCLLSLFVSGTSDVLTMQYLRWFENAVGWLKSFIGLFKLGAFATGLALIGIYFLGLAQIPTKHTERLLSDLKQYKKFIKWAYLIVVILFSFTFFGVQSDKPAADLQFRIKENDKLYGELRDEVEAALRKEVADKLYFQIYHSLPRDYRIDMDRGDDGPEPPDGWSPTPSPSPSPSPNGEGGGDNWVGSTDVSGPLVYDLFDDSRSEEQATASAPDYASASRIERVFEGLRRYRANLPSKNIGLKITDLGREMAVQPANGAINYIKDYALRECMSHPLAEFIAGWVKGLADKGSELLVHKAADRIAGKAVQDPEAIRQLINIEAREIVARKSIGPIYGFSARVEQVRELIKKQWAGVTGPSVRSDPKQSAEQTARINEQIHLLTCPDENNRLNAARKLAQGGARLTKPQVQDIKDVLKKAQEPVKITAENPQGVQRFRFGLSTTAEGMFVEVPLKYYPALALEGMRSRHVSSEDRVAAAEIIYDVETHPPARQYTKEEVADRMVA